MKKQTFLIALSISMLTTVTGCAVVGDIFKAGVGVGIFIVVVIIVLIILFVSRMRKNK